MKIAVAGTGYVGLSIATLLSQNHEVMAVDIVPEKVEKINKRISPIQDEYIEKYLKEKELKLTATLDAEAAYKDADFVVIAALDLSQYLGHILVETAKTFSLFLNLQTPVELSNESNYGFDYDYKILQCS
ncbi:UDP-glucose 6-dehydrogenase [Enterococcus faecium]|nr:NAD(P)-binding domain-containing protein [Enterococcus faecium]QTO57070.1 NAD(P)-binding domain-containing protein [Enterococcus faecium]SMJ22822.1 UDP-glucose 6-dehydrogenase [Enterococcus faecium]SMJ34559.1 UDP-glucose 6-dehydrogenase [Enterococcus faecium]SMJ71482.1 UDP-glucose 6-dehydrogenase [Enterococcus faecium]